MANKFDLIW